jgi:hypothetical protein
LLSQWPGIADFATSVEIHPGADSAGDVCLLHAAALCCAVQSLPVPHQTLLFSATMPKEIEQLAAQYLNKPVKVKVGRVSVPTANVAQSLQRCIEGEKVELLVAMLQVRQALMSVFIPVLMCELTERVHRVCIACILLGPEGHMQVRPVFLQQHLHREIPVLVQVPLQDWYCTAPVLF